MRMPRINLKDALYYVTSRGDNNEELFKDPGDYNTYTELLKKYKEQYGFKIFSYCLVPNHLHLLIELKEGTTISQVMHNLHSNYTKYFNKKHDKQGHLFQERYKLILMEKAPYLLDISAYIHLNPLALNLVKDLDSYSYSSYPAYIGKEKDQLNLKNETGEVMSYLKGKDYASFVKDFYQNKSKIVTEEINRKSILGSDEFIERAMVEAETSKPQEEKIDEVNAARNKKLISTGIFAIIILGLVSAYLYINTLQVKNNLKQEIVNKERELGVKVDREKEVLIKSLDEKNRADKVSYQVMQKRLEVERAKAEELEKKLEANKK